MMILEWENIKYTVEQKSENYKWWNILGYNPTSTRKVILDSVSGKIKSGQLVAILGPSGAGKTTLIAAISQRIRRGKLTGDLIYNGAKLRTEEMTKLSVFVPQTEILMESLTLFEHIYFQSLFKMSRNTSKAMHVNNINRILNQLNLMSCRTTRINKLSGGERKKLNLACELLIEPIMIFCDEPTTGLDSYNALSVVKTLKQLTRYSEENVCELESSLKIVLCSIHQPTSDIFHEFTHIILMSHGRILYQGTMQEAELFFFKLDFICPAHYNPAEYYIKVIKTSDAQDPKADKIYQHYKNQQTKIMINQHGGNGMANYSDNVKLTERNENKILWSYQFWVLLYRFILNGRQNKLEKMFIVLSSLVSASTMVLLYSNIKYGTQNSIQDIEGAIIIMSSEVLFTFAYAVLYDFPAELPMIRRELGEKLYSFSAYYFANSLMSIPIIVIESISFLLVIALFTNLIPSLMQFGQIFLVLVCGGITANAFGYLTSGFSFNYAIEIAGSSEVLLLALGGFYMSLKSFSILKYFSPFFFCNEAISIIYWSDVSDIQCSKNVGFPCLRNGTEVLAQYSYTSSSLANDFIGFGTWTLVAHFIAFFGIRRQIKREGYY